MPRRNMNRAVDRFITRFYPDSPEDIRAARRPVIDAFIRDQIAANPAGISTREMERVFAEKYAADPEIKSRPKLGENKSVWGFYAVAGNRIIAGPFETRDDPAIESGWQIITATEAKRRGYLSRYRAEMEIRAASAAGG